MRRRRHKLEVSTFPFLAVLLCAMGSLILLLLVIDRRAKAVARAKAIAIAERLEAEDSQAAAERAAEIERRRQALHAVLENQAKDVRSQFEHLRTETRATVGLLSSEIDRTKNAEAQVAVIAARIARKKSALTARRTETADQAHLSDAAKREVARLAADLAQLEQTLGDLKALRKREQQMFSVVPYRGKRGDSRKPIYVECTATGLVFHPDRKALADLSPSGKEIRDEVDRRLEQVRVAGGDAQARLAETSYVLMLVRPTGVPVYYHTLAALSALKVDFGYEFVEEDWVLDFPSEDGPLRTLPWMTAQNSESPGRSPASGHTAAKVTPKSVHGVDFHSNMATAVGPSPSTAFSNHPGEPSAAPLRREAHSSMQPLGPGSGGAHGIGGGVLASASVGGSPIEGTVGDRLPMPAATASGAAPPLYAGDPSVSSGAGVASSAPVPPTFSPAGYGAPEMARTPPGGAFAAGSPSQPAGGPTATGGLASTTAVSPDPSAGPAGQSPSDQIASGSGGAGPDGATGSGTSGTPRGAGASPSEAGGSPGDGGDGAGGGPLSTLVPSAFTRKPKPVPLVKRRPLNLNRDWHIPLECRGDGVTILVTQQHFGLEELAQTHPNPLLLVVQQMIDRRQARVPPGEPPYRPMLRFQIKADGLRAYYLAYPVLGMLNVPMMREDCDPETASRGERNSR